LQETFLTFHAAPIAAIAWRGVINCENALQKHEQWYRMIENIGNDEYIDEEENPYMDQFGDMLYEEYAKKATDNQSLGIAKMLYDAMKRNTGTDTE
jgi:hypothetical protein